jgi:preprotein translocase subunit SecA
MSSKTTTKKKSAKKATTKSLKDTKKKASTAAKAETVKKTEVKSKTTKTVQDTKATTTKKTIKSVKPEVNKPTPKTKPKGGKDLKDKSFASRLLSRLVGEQKEISKYDKEVQKILDLDEEYQKLSDQELKAKTGEFRALFKDLEKQEDIDKKLKEILPEAFATVREAAYRVIKQKHYPVQLIGGMVLNDGRIAEMKTGEGKTLVSTLAGYLNALPGKNQVHLVTVNDYLARRDASWMGQIYDFLGLTIGVIQNQASFYFKLGAQADDFSDQKRAAGLLETYEDGIQQDSRTVLDVENLVPCDRKRAYWDDEKNEPVDIVYGVNSEFGFDYLRDNMASTPKDRSQKAGLSVAIVDEVDSILIDEARTPLIISSQDANSSDRYRQFAKLVSKLKADIDYEVDEKRRIVTMTELGIEKVERELGMSNFYGSSDNVVLIHHLDQALKAAALFNKDKEYVVRQGEVMIVDESTGRIMFGRRYNQGLHQAIEAKEGVNVQPESKTTASITFQNYFRLYSKLAGMTGTAATESEEFFKIYKLLVVTIPTNRPIARRDLPDKIFKNEYGKFQAIVKDVKRINHSGQPVLIGTTSIDKNAILSEQLKAAGVPHQILNAKNHEQEAKIISGAGRKGAVTLATNIAGRGIDIKLGGEPPRDEKNLDDWKKEHQEVVKLGGLYVIGTERHESRRVDNQLRGRSGRQGDPGVSQFYISLQDYLLRVFGGDRLGFYSILPIADDQAIENPALSALIEQAQKKIEGQNFDIRKHVTEYDDVINRQRGVIYERRRKVLMNEEFNYQVEIEKILYRQVLSIVQDVPKPNKRNQQSYQAKLKQASKDLKAIISIADFDEDVLTILLKDEKYNYRKIAAFLAEKLYYQLNKHWDSYSTQERSAITRFGYLRANDILWIEHLVTIEHLQDAVRLRSYSQKDPLTEFKEEGLKVFMSLLREIDKEIAKTIFKITPDLVPSGIMEVDKK